MCGSMADIQSLTAEIRRGKKERRNHRMKIYMACPITKGGQSAINNVSCSVDQSEAVSMIMEHCVGTSVMIFSDSSVCSESVSCGACAAVLFPVLQTDPVQIDTFAVGSRVSSLDCETEGVILGIKMAIKYFEASQDLHPVQDVFIFSDRYSTVENIARMKFNTRPDIYIKLQDLRHQLLKLSIHIQLVYVKAHSGITGNDIADQYSKELAHRIP